MPLSIYVHAILPMIYHLIQKWFPWKQALTLKIDHLMHSKVPWQVWHYTKAQRSSRSHPFHQNSIRQMFPELTHNCSELLHLTEKLHPFQETKYAFTFILKHALCFYDTQEEFITIHLLNSNQGYHHSNHQISGYKYIKRGIFKFKRHGLFRGPV